MISFRAVRSRFKVSGFNCHHLLPTQVTEAKSFAIFFAELKMEGFDPDDFQSNGLHLPATDENAIAFSLPLHRGPHPKYNEYVSDRIAPLTCLTAIDGLAAVTHLQSELRQALRTGGSGDIKLLRNPMDVNLRCDFETMGLIGYQFSRVARIS